MLNGIEELARRNQLLVASGEKLSRKTFASRGRIAISTSELHAVTSLSTGRNFAMEVFPAVAWEKRTEEQLRVLLRCSHEHIVTLHAAWEEEGTVLTLTDLPESSLLDRLRRHRALGEAEAGAVAADVCKALIYLHGLNPPVLARAPTPSQLLFVGGRAKLTAARIEDAAGQCLAPESLRGEPIGEKGDVWMLGALLFEMTQGRMPFRSRTQSDKQKSDKLAEENAMLGRLELDRPLSEEALDSLRRMLSPSEAVRPTAREVLDLNFFRRLRKVPLSSQRQISSQPDSDETPSDLLLRVDQAEKRQTELLRQLQLAEPTSADKARLQLLTDRVAEARRQLQALEAQEREGGSTVADGGVQALQAELQRKSEQNHALFAFSRGLAETIGAMSGLQVTTSSQSASIDPGRVKAALSALLSDLGRGGAMTAR